MIFDPSKERPSITPFTQRQAKYAEWIWAELERQNRSNPAMHIQLVGGNDPYVLQAIFPSAFAINDRSWRLALKALDTIRYETRAKLVRLEAHRRGSNAFLIWHKKSTWSTLSPHKTTKGECTRAKNRHATRHTLIE